MRALLLLVAVGCYVGCYSPSIQNGGLECAVGDICPDGYFCGQGHCWAHGSVLSVDAGVEVAPDAVRDATVDAVVDATPVVRLLGETCDPRNAGTAQRVDNCAAGLACIDGSYQSLCFQRCATDAECPQSRCESRQPDPGVAAVRVCGLASAACSPLTPSSCPDQRVCYLSSGRTVCEISSGDNVRMSCTYSRECLPGYTCATGVGAGYCRRTCDEANACPVESTCQIVTGALGYCY